MKHLSKSLAFLSAMRDVDAGLVKFLKKDGTRRTIKFTTSLKKIPKDKHPKTESKDNQSSIFRVFDVVENSWKSIDFNRVSFLEVQKGELKEILVGQNTNVEREKTPTTK